MRRMRVPFCGLTGNQKESHAFWGSPGFDAHPMYCSQVLFGGHGRPRYRRLKGPPWHGGSLYVLPSWDMGVSFLRFPLFWLF